MYLHHPQRTRHIVVYRFMISCLFILCGLFVVAPSIMGQGTTAAHTHLIDSQPTPSTPVHLKVLSSPDAESTAGYGAGALGALPQSQHVSQGCSLWIDPSAGCKTPSPPLPRILPAAS